MELFFVLSVHQMSGEVIGGQPLRLISPPGVIGWAPVFTSKAEAEAWRDTKAPGSVIVEGSASVRA